LANNRSTFQSDIYSNQVATTEEVPFSEEMFFEVPFKELLYDDDLRKGHYSEILNTNQSSYQPRKGKSK
jgi:hypothetical protein